MFPIVQVAGIHDQAEADMLIERGVDWAGFPLRLSVKREDISEDDAGRVMRTVEPPKRAVLITYLHTAEAIVALCRKLGTSTIQLHGDIPEREVVRVKEHIPDAYIIKSLVVRPGNLETLRRLMTRFTPYVDGFITDTFDPATGACGATGKTHDWIVSRQLVRLSQKPVILAGGLTPENVGRAIREVLPAGVDAHTGLEGPDGRKDPDKVSRFVSEARAAFAANGIVRTPPKKTPIRPATTG